jgi:hypothetical protein
MTTMATIQLFSMTGLRTKRPRIWPLGGSAELLLANDERRAISVGHLIRTPAGESHGVTNSGTEPFIYLAITTPPADFRGAYQAGGEPSLKDLLLTDAARGDLRIPPRGMFRRRRPSSDSEI